MNEIILPKSDSELIAQCEVQTFRSQGSGGQSVNTTDSAVRLIHLPSGLVVTSQQERSQYLNKMLCLKKLREKVVRLNYRAPPRIPTRISKKKKMENVDRKIKHGQKKKGRQKKHEIIE